MLIIYGCSISAKPPFKLVQAKVENGNIDLIQRPELFKEFVKSYSYHVLCHAILKDSHYSLVFGTIEGELLLINKQYELKLKLLCQPMKQLKIEQILPLDGRFAVAGSSHCIQFFNKNPRDLKNPYSLSEHKIDLHAHVFNSVNNIMLLSEGVFLIGLSSGELLQAALLSNKNGTGSHYKIESCLLQLHTNTIHDMVICERKPILITSSKDMTITVFNYAGKSIYIYFVYFVSCFIIYFYVFISIFKYTL